MLHLGTITPPAENCAGLHPEYLVPPPTLIHAGFLSGGGGFGDGASHPLGANYGRPIQPLIDVATRLRDGDATPDQILAEAAIEMVLRRLGRSANPDLGIAIADLTVTGRAAWSRFRSAPPNDASVLAAARSEAARRGVPDDALLAGSVRGALDRAYVIAWNLRGPLAFRERSRPAQRWIAVVGEVDPPDRPVNVPSAPFPQHDLDLRVSGRSVRTRVVVGSAARHPSEEFDWSGLDLRSLPPERELWIPPDDEVVLFLHGHSSRAEEGLALTEAMHAEARRRGTSVTVLAFDFPSNGYSEMLDPNDISPIDRAQFHLLGPLRPEDSTYPCLRFIENHIRAVVDEVDRRQGIKSRIVGVVGGSLGGNMALRLGYREESATWARNRISWSPASAWGASWGGASINPFEYTNDPYRYYDHVKHEGVRITRDRTVEPETPARRAEYFRRVFEGVFPEPPQADRWYRDGWPCKQDTITSAIRDRVEVYGDRFRRWHWRVAHEQLIYSHFEPLARDGAPHFTDMQGRLMLLVGTHDNHFPEYIHDRVIGDMAGGLGHLSGKAAGVADTGHSIQAERPGFLARLALDFFATEQWAFRATNGRFVTVAPNPGRRLEATASMLGSWETFTAIRQSNDDVAFEAASGHYVAANNGGGRELVANRVHIRSWERFEVEEVEGATVALRTAPRPGSAPRYLTRNAERGDELRATATEATGDALFHRVDLAGVEVRWFVGTTGALAHARGEGGIGVRSGATDEFRLVELGRDEVAIRAPNGRFLHAEDGGGAGLTSDNRSIGGWGVFTRVPLDAGGFALRAASGQFLVDRGGVLRIDASRDQASVMRFQPARPVMLDIPLDRLNAILGRGRLNRILRPRDWVFRP
jgi:hypothetical protein